jgi:hypothetical protein
LREFDEFAWQYSALQFLTLTARGPPLRAQVPTGHIPELTEDRRDCAKELLEESKLSIAIVAIAMNTPVCLPIANLPIFFSSKPQQLWRVV